jgi:hypothetical protein
LYLQIWGNDSKQKLMKKVIHNELTGLGTDKRTSKGCVKKREIALGKLLEKFMLNTLCVGISD